MRLVSASTVRVSCICRKAFTIIEMLVAITILALLLSLMVSVLNHATSTIQRSSSQTDAFTASRAAFDLLTRRLSQASLNTYWDYDNPTQPTRYIRQSDLHFLIRQNDQNPAQGQELFFQAPETYSKSASYQSASGLLNASGFRVRYGNDNNFRPGTADAPRWRYRLMQTLQPAEDLKVFNDKTPNNPSWIQSASDTELPVADNIIALVVWPRLPIGEDPTGKLLSQNYLYNSRDNAQANPQPSTANQLPPVVQVTMVVISESAANRIDTKSSSAPPEIEAALAGKFTNVSNFQKDIDDLSQALSDKNIAHEVFTTSVVMRGAKWSQ